MRADPGTTVVVSSERKPAERKPAGFAAIGLFLFFGSAMAGLAAITLLRRGSVLDRIWELNPTAYAQLAPLGEIAGPLFLGLSAALGCAGIGWFKRRRWGWRLAVAIIAIQVFGDLVNIFRGDLLRGSAGVTLAGALLFYLLRPSVRAGFASSAVSGENPAAR